MVTGLTRRPPPADKAAAAVTAAKAADSQPASESMSIGTDTDAQSVSVIGTLVGGRYRIRRLCGEGGMGRVYEAEHIEIGKRVALKILHPAYSQTPDLVERLKREARAASKISHPNVVDVTDSGTTPDGSFFFVMEYIEGIELGELIFREKRLEVPRALVITAQVCRALHAAHQVNVIHRDLKPENVLILSRDGQRDFIKVLDFGIAKSGDTEDSNNQSKPSRRLTHPGMTMGTPEYMAPEQATGHPADPRSDVYAVGGILYEMLSGKPPYEGANFMEILNKKANTLPPPLGNVRSDVPAELEALITRTLAKVPGARPQTMEELEREIQQIATRFFPPRTEQDLAIVAGAGGLAAASLDFLAGRARFELDVSGVGSDHRRRRGAAAASLPQVGAQEDRDGGGRRVRAAAWRGGAGRDLQARQQGRGPPGGDRIAATRAGDSARDRTTRATSGAGADRHDADLDEAGRGAGRREGRDRRGRRQRRQRQQRQQDRRRASRRPATTARRAAGAPRARLRPTIASNWKRRSACCAPSGSPRRAGSSRAWPSRGAIAGRRWSAWPRSRSRRSTTKTR